MNPVVHFEMPFDDKARLTRFYEQAFGWQMQGMGAGMGDYVLATTTPSDAGGRPTGIARSTAASSRRSPTGPRRCLRS